MLNLSILEKLKNFYQLNNFSKGGSLITLFDFCTYTTAFKHLGLNKNLNYLMLSVSM